MKSAKKCYSDNGTDFEAKPRPRILKMAINKIIFAFTNFLRLPTQIPKTGRQILSSDLDREKSQKIGSYIQILPSDHFWYQLMASPSQICLAHWIFIRDFREMVQGVWKKLSFAKLSICRSCEWLGRNIYDFRGKSSSVMLWQNSDTLYACKVSFEIFGTLCSVIFLLQTELKPSSETLSNPVVTYPCIVITLALLGLPSQGCIGLNISMYIAPPHPQWWN